MGKFSLGRVGRLWDGLEVTPRAGDNGDSWDFTLGGFPNLWNSTSNLWNSETPGTAPGHEDEQDTALVLSSSTPGWGSPWNQAAEPSLSWEQGRALQEHPGSSPGSSLGPGAPTPAGSFPSPPLPRQHKGRGCSAHTSLIVICDTPATFQLIRSLQHNRHPRYKAKPE